MQNINRVVIVGLTMAVVGFGASATPVSAQGKEARGNVTAVTETTMTVKAGAQDLTFYIDNQTHLEVRSSAKQVQQAQPKSPKPRVNDFFEAGTPVLVRYEDVGGRHHALNIERVGSAGNGGGGSVKESAKLAEGKVTSVSGSQVTVAVDGHDMTFAIDRDTDVLARGASTATKAAGGNTTLTTFIHNGDQVSVSYRDAAGKMTASEIRVRVANK
jgi:hypothetical protein